MEASKLRVSETVILKRHKAEFLCVPFYTDSCNIKNKKLIVFNLELFLFRLRLSWQTKH